MSSSQLQDFIFHHVRKLPYVYSCYDDAEGHLIFFQIVNVDSVKLHTREKLKICEMTKCSWKQTLWSVTTDLLELHFESKLKSVVFLHDLQIAVFQFYAFLFLVTYFVGSIHTHINQEQVLNIFCYCGVLTPFIYQLKMSREIIFNRRLEGQGESNLRHPLLTGFSRLLHWILNTDITGVEWDLPDSSTDQTATELYQSILSPRGKS